MNTLTPIQLMQQKRDRLDLDEKYVLARKAKIAAMPRVRFRYGRDYETYQNIIGVWWDKNPTAPEGEFIYRKWIKFLWSFRFDVSSK